MDAAYNILWLPGSLDGRRGITCLLPTLPSLSNAITHLLMSFTDELMAPPVQARQSGNKVSRLAGRHSRYAVQYDLLT
jgi:hypothetical protein